MAGRSARFKNAGIKKPKYLLEGFNYKILQEKFDEFKETDSFYLIFNIADYNENKLEIEEILENKLNVKVIIIEPNTVGPVYSILGIDNINKDEPILISYCDFFVQWDYKKALQSFESSDICIPTFTGFNPCSLGSTMYAYIKTLNGKIIELREKQSFTNDRMSEHASVGIYYFKSWNLFARLAKLQLQSPDPRTSEQYVSTLANIAIEENLSVTYFKVDKFICLGTPDDYHEFTRWKIYFNDPLNSSDSNTFDGINLVPMAGLGSRFVDFGYSTQKPFISVLGLPIFQHTILSLPKTRDYIFITRNVKDKRKIFNNFSGSESVQILDLNYLPNGQLMTCLNAIDLIDDDKPLYISSCDYAVKFNFIQWSLKLHDSDADGFVWTVKLGNKKINSYEAFAYCLIENGDNILKIVEKETLSKFPQDDHMVIGTFFFKNAKIFKKLAYEAIEANVKTKGEFYIATAIDYAIKKGYNFKNFEVDDWVSLGDPIELQIYEFWYKLFVEDTYILSSDGRL